jgi:hypothetical protein
VTNHVSNGGAALLASDSSGPYINASFAGFKFGKFNSYPTKDTDAFNDLKDCPVISDFRSHPIFSGVQEIVTNRPGFVSGNRQTIMAQFPRSYQGRRQRSFAAVRQNRGGGRAVVVGDQSIFTNQMIIYGSNAVFAQQAVKWLKNDQLKKMLILIDGAELSSLEPSDVVVDVPAPTREEVMDALQNLPPAAMLDFANSIATVVEDENMVNEFVRDSVDKIPPKYLNRFYVFLMFGIACFTFIAAFLCQGKLQRQTASELAVKRSNYEEVEMKMIQAGERQQAAHVLLDRFCMDLANRRFSDWPSFPTGLSVDDDRQSKALFQSMTKMSVLYKSKPASFWTRKKLLQLDRLVEQWRSYFAGRSNPVDLELLTNQDLWKNGQLPEAAKS